MTRPTYAQRLRINDNGDPLVIALKNSNDQQGLHQSAVPCLGSDVITNR